MKKDVTIIRCDGAGCREYVEWEKTKTGSVVAEVSYPPGWYTVRQVGENGNPLRDQFDFHSLVCVGRWARARRMTAAGAAGATEAKTTHRYDKKPCPVCSKPIAPQGMFLHYKGNPDHAEAGTYEEFKAAFEEAG
jgi:hypothetical protein